jgi:non-ribosomal peptide synthase protein (TIGR01720 family)
MTGAGGEPLTLLPEQQRFLARRLPAEHHWNLQGVRPIAGCMASTRGRAALRQLVLRHDALRTVLIAPAGGERRAVLVSPEMEVPIQCLDLSDVPDTRLKEEIRHRTAQLHKEMDLYAWPLFRLVCLHLARRSFVLLAIVHHLICEEVSFRILMEDLLRLLAGAGEEGGPPPALRPWASVKDLGDWLVEVARTDEVRAHLDRWCRIGEPAAPVPAELGDGSTNDLASSEFAVAALTKEKTAAVVRGAAAPGRMTLRNRVLLALLRTLCEMFDIEAVSIRCHCDGRAGVVRPLNVARTFGWLSATYPITFRRPRGRAWSEANLREHLSQVPSRGETFGVLRFLSQEPAVRDRLQQLGEPDVQLNWLGMRSHSGRLRPVAAEAPFEFEQRRLGNRDSRHNVVAAVVNGQLVIQWGYSRNLYRPATVEALTARAAAMVGAGLGDS